MAPIQETVRMARQSLRGNTTRTVLTLLGMAIGVFSVIASVTAVAVLEGAVLDNLAGLGSSTITFYASGEGTAEEDRARRQPLTIEQADRLQDRVKLAETVSPYATWPGASVRGGGEKTDPTVIVVGSDEAFAGDNALDVDAGRFLNDDDVRAGRAVVVLGSSLAETLFGDREPVGEEVRIDGPRFLVIGVLEPTSGGFGFIDPNNRAYVPIDRLLDLYGVEKLDGITVRAASPEETASVRDEAIGVLRAIRRLRPEAENDFEVQSSEALAEGFESATNALSFGGAGIGLIALLAAGVGVMNILLVSVTERTREIGVRKSLGATRRDILTQFLVEAILMCQIGGLVGLGFGVLGGNLLAAVLKSAPAFPWGWAIGAVLGVTVVALVFGVYPAVKAARLRPIDALRYE